MKQNGDDYFGTGKMVFSLKHEGTTAWLRETLKMSVRTSVISAVQSFNRNVEKKKGKLFRC